MPRAAHGWFSDYDSLTFGVQHLRNSIIVGLGNKEGERIALDLPADSAGLLALVGHGTDRERCPFDREVEITGKLYVSAGADTVAASCDDRLEPWEGPQVLLRVGFEPHERALTMAVRDPFARRGFSVKLPNSARNALFAAIWQPREDHNIKILGRGRLEGRLSVTT
jgi:hypothetical protein